jgi:hypothetical protein
VAVGVEVKKMSGEAKSWIQSFGVIDGGLELMKYAWPSLDHKFSVRRNNTTLVTDDAKTEIVLGHHRYPKDLLRKNPVDLLTVEQGHLKSPPVKYRRTPWEDLIGNSPKESRPKVVIETWSASAQMWRQGPVCKAHTTVWKEMGFTTRCRLINATEVGGAIHQERLIVARVHVFWEHLWTWDKIEAGQEVLRPMSNLLTPPGLVPVRMYDRRTDRTAPNSRLEPMPSHMGAWVETERGIRRLMPEETSKGLGAPKEERTTLSASILKCTTSLFHWEYLSSSLILPSSQDADTHVTALLEDEDDWSLSDSESDDENTTFDWTPPDLSVGGEWYNERVTTLWEAATTMPNPEEVVKEGLELLKIHRGNYTATGPSPKQLQLLWWEFPPEHWTALREGCRMNFLVEPESCIHDNAPMDQEQLDVAAAFVDELLELKIVKLMDDGREVLANSPLFTVPKEGQEGQWRVIADMLRGGQNSCIGPDPCVLPRQSHILDQMYEGGYSAVVDASKFFHQFPTHPDDRPFLGLKHPVTGVLYVYRGLPMGGGSSPGIAGQFGLSLLRLLRENSEIFQGEARANCWWTGFSETGFDPKLGYGFVLHAKDGPAVKMWVWVDDFIIHGPTHEKTMRALNYFLDTTVKVGMLCHPKKLTPPAQVVKYCGFLFDTRGIPCLRIPVAKRERAYAIVQHLRQAPLNRRWSRLSLAVAAGVLESLIEATPRRIGHTYLRRFHSVVHPEGLGTGLDPYLTLTSLTPAVRKDLEWWATFLKQGGGRYARATESATLVPSWGDGSGTGTGGTYELPEAKFIGPARGEVPASGLRMWKGKWSPLVYHFSSNWKELQTLNLTLQRIEEEDPVAVRGTTVFYFTDNSTTYWIAASGSSKSAGLHALIEEIRTRELRLGCYLEVIHVPGIVMIQQGADALSRGIWISPLQGLMDPRRITQAVFDPLPFDACLTQYYVDQLPAMHHMDRAWTYCLWNCMWDARRVFDRLTVWFPPPELARQVLTFVLESWAERPLTTSGLFFIPRTVPAFWRGISRHLVELPTLFPHETKLPFPPILPIPVIVLYLPPHQRSLSTKDRLARVAVPANTKWHREQAALLRGMPPLPVDGSCDPV